jgi:hypothetical protein
LELPLDNRKFVEIQRLLLGHDRDNWNYLVQLPRSYSKGYQFLK